MKTDYLFNRHFKNSMGSRHATIQSGRLDGSNDKNSMSVTFTISHTNKIRRIRALRELETFIQDYNNQKENITGFVMSIVSTDHNAIADEIKIELNTKESLRKLVGISSFNMTFDVEGISETDLPYIYGGVVNNSRNNKNLFFGEL